LGLGGAALASVAGGILAFFAGMGMLRDKNSVLRFRLPRSPGGQLIALLSAGSPSALNNICQAAQIFFINLLFIRTGIGALLPGYSLVFTVSELVLAVIRGTAQMTLPLVGVSFGERDFRSIRLVMKKAMGIGNAIVGGCVILLLILRQKLGMLFGLTDPLVLRHAGIGIVFLAFSLNLALVNNVLMSFFSAVRRTAIANAIVVFRMILFMVIPAYALFSLANVYSVWIGLILAEFLTLGAVYLIVTVKHAKKPGLSRYLLLDESLLENSKVIDFSVENTSGGVVFASDKISGFCEENGVPPKKTMRISLAIEEMIVMINQNSIKGDTAYTDVRIMIIGERIVMRIRNLGKYFNPVEYYYENKDTEEGREKTLGIAMILKLAQETEYQETFGVNNLLITI
jgi:anti-sigma regulatory factor (Ser/Thr protein kinase)